MTVRSALDRSPEIVIRGAGIIGLSVAWSLLQKGIRPKILDTSSVNQRASWAAAGMLSAQFEALIEPDVSSGLRDFSAHSSSIWPEFAARLEKASGTSVGYRPGPTLGLVRSDQLSVLERDNRLGGLVETASDTFLEQSVPGLQAEGYRKVLFPLDGQVDNRAVLQALLRVCAECLTDDASVAQSADILVDCMGWQSPDVRPVKGQMVSLKPDASHPQIPVRWGAAYIVPKSDRTIIGATVEPDNASLDTQEAVSESLLASAFNLIPDMSRDAEILERWAGLRPMARRQRPRIGWLDEGRHYLATGHYRNGILLTPATAELVVCDLLGEPLPVAHDLSDLRP